MSAGTYILKSGNAIYIGSSSRLSSRKSDHFKRLEKGIHRNPKIQAAYDREKTVSFIPKTFLHMTPGESKQDFRDRLRQHEQTLLNEYSDSPFLCNESMNARGPDATCAAKRKPLSPEAKARISAAKKGIPISDEAKAKMSLAKLGKNNPNSRKIQITCPDGEIKHFDSVTDMAKFFNVSQQTADLWVRGISAWPGTSKRNKSKNAWIAQYSLVKSD